MQIPTTASSPPLLSQRTITDEARFEDLVTRRFGIQHHPWATCRPFCHVSKILLFSDILLHIALVIIIWYYLNKILWWRIFVIAKLENKLNKNEKHGKQSSCSRIIGHNLFFDYLVFKRFTASVYALIILALIKCFILQQHKIRSNWPFSWHVVYVENVISLYLYTHNYMFICTYILYFKYLWVYILHEILWQWPKMFIIELKMILVFKYVL